MMNDDDDDDDDDDDEEILQERKRNLKNINTSPEKGVLAKYKHLVGSASKGAVTDSYDQ